MGNPRRKLARGNSSWPAGKKAYARRKVPRADVDMYRQELVPGIPNHLTMRNITSKLDWETCNVLQMVSRGWRQAIHNREIYDAKVLSKSTKAFLVVLTYKMTGKMQEPLNVVLSLCSCRDHYFLRLPPIPPIPYVFVHPEYVDCVCLEGRVYLWIRQRNTKRVHLYVLDLAGHRKWEKRKSVTSLHCSHGLGVLEGKIYRFRASTCDVLTGDDPFQGRPLSIEEKVKKLPYTEMYDPLHDAWSLITPAPPVSTVLSNADLEHHVASFSDWAEEMLAADPSKTFLTNGRYESYFSEWKQKQSHECSFSTVDNDSGNGMATQVYYCHLRSYSTLPTIDTRSEEVCFVGGKLVKYEKYLFGSLTGAALDIQEYNVQTAIDIQEYNAQTAIWKHWKSVSMNFQSLKDGRIFSINEIDGIAAANNYLWAIVGVKDGLLNVTYFLLRSLELLGDNNVKNLTWIDTGFRRSRSIYFSQHHALKPIYL